MSTTDTTKHIGRTIRRLRELRGMKQETLAVEMGVSQQTVSNIEKNEAVEAKLLAQVAEILGVTPEAIENFSEEAMINYFNTFNDNSGTGAYCTNQNSTGADSTNQSFTFNPIDKLIDAYEANTKLHERLLEAEKTKVSYLEKLLAEKGIVK